MTIYFPELNALEKHDGPFFFIVPIIVHSLLVLDQHI